MNRRERFWGNAQWVKPLPHTHKNLVLNLQKPQRLCTACICTDWLYGEIGDGNERFPVSFQISNLGIWSGKQQRNSISNKMKAGTETRGCHLSSTHAPWYTYGYIHTHTHILWILYKKLKRSFFPYPSSVKITDMCYHPWLIGTENQT